MSPSSDVIFGTVAPQFVVDDVVATAAYYRDALGFEMTDAFLDPPVHIVMTRGQSQIFLAQAKDASGTSNRRLKPVAIDAYFRVRGLDALASQFAERGVVVIEGPTTRVYSVREIVIEDCNGFVLVFGEDA